MSAAGYYAYHQHNNSVDEEDSPLTTTSTTTHDTPTVIANGSSSHRTNYRTRVLNASNTPSTVTGRRVLITDDDEDGNASTMSASSASSSSSSTILAPRPTTTTTTAPRNHGANDTRQQQQQQQPSSSSSASTPPPSSRINIATRQQQQQQQDQQPSAQQPTSTSDDDRRCWICFGEDEDSEGIWVKPCKCSLVSHEQCLLDWISENQKGSPLKKVYCPQCNTPYSLMERRSVSLALLSLIDTLARTAAPYLTFLGLGCSVLLTSTTYGAYTVMTLFGARQGERLIGRPAFWTWRTWLGLPAIPAALVLSRSRWADGVLPFAAMLILRATSANQQGAVQMTWPPSPAVTLGVLPWIRLLYNNLYLLAQHHLSRKLLHLRNRQTSPQQQQQQAGTDPTAAFRQVLEQNGVDILADPVWEGRRQQHQRDEETRRVEQEQENALMEVRESNDLGVTVIGALLWPTISSIVGSCLNHFKLVRQHFPEPFHRNVLGGCLFVVVKDMASLLYKYERIKQRQSRRVRNYSEIANFPAAVYFLSLSLFDRSHLMPGNKKHTLKNIKNRDAVHPYSRKAQQLQRVILRKNKLTQKKGDRTATNSRVERWLWFRYALDESIQCATKQQIHDLIEMYIERNDEQLQTLEAERQKLMHKRKDPKYDLLVANKELDLNEYKSGIELPDFNDGKNLKRLRDWDGDVNSMPLIKTRLYRQSDNPKYKEPKESNAMDVESKKATSNKKSLDSSMDMDTN
ncbi:ring finger domain-containing protein [Lichtheimia corymbifera JMRC:FSU:9682]|uniref:Ring finger domain-containing protein n=1 Tax=Lichtheimia corymbifera JMRC:FSU:9682 TaxID=1263082 RepID=A0A068S5L6_9FUNG|nr:ring finger domain-containing protein [Lichtheimia corymbifera JMRC:FSU:9682]